MRDAHRMNRTDLVALVRKIVEADGTEAEIDEYTEQVSKELPDPNWMELIYFDPRDLTPEEVVEVALSYRPILL